jgi:extradiol dioxygenase family protein
MTMPLHGFLHLSLPVLDLDDSLAFYVDVLGCTPGRLRPEQGFVDVWFYGLQLTLQDQPDQVLPPEQQGARHFGVALPADELARVLARLETTTVEWAERPTTDTSGWLDGKTSAKVFDPSGNVIELKTYPPGRADIIPG